MPVPVRVPFGIANLTKEETRILVHYGLERSMQFVLIRLEEPEEK